MNVSEKSVEKKFTWIFFSFTIFVTTCCFIINDDDDDVLFFFVIKRLIIQKFIAHQAKKNYDNDTNKRKFHFIDFRTCLFVSNEAGYFLFSFQSLFFDWFFFYFHWPVRLNNIVYFDFGLFFSGTLSGTKIIHRICISLTGCMKKNQIKAIFWSIILADNRCRRIAYFVMVCVCVFVSTINDRMYLTFFFLLKKKKRKSKSEWMVKKNRTKFCCC